MDTKFGASRSAKTMCSAKYVVRTTLDEVVWVTGALKELMPTRFSEEEGYAVELGIAEVLTNIVQHGCTGQEDGSITILWEEQINHLQINIFDTGLSISQNLLELQTDEMFDFDKNDIENLPENGFGLALIKTIFHAVDYHSIDGVNHMHLEKYFQS